MRKLFSGEALIKIYTYRDLRDLDYLDSACRIHNISFPYDNVECEIFRSFVLGDENLSEEAIYFAISENRVLGFLIGVEISREPVEAIDKYRDTIFVKDLAADPRISTDDWRRVLVTMLREFEELAKSRGKKAMILYAYAPYYFMPGINIFYEDYLELFESLGYSKKSETVSYEINLERFYYLRRVSRIEDKLRSDGVVFRRAEGNEAERVSKWVGERFGPFWRLESLYAFRHKPPSIWVAEQSGELVGFSVYLRMGRNEFGPIGVDPGKRGSGIGTVLMFKSLYDLKQLGYRYAVIPWTSHLFFYTQVPGIERIKHYYIMSKTI